MPVSPDQHELGRDPVGALLYRYSLPAIVGMVGNALYNVVDAVFIGHGIGQLGLAAMAVCFPIHMFFLAAGQLVGLGAGSILSRALGARDRQLAARAAGTSFSLVILLSLGLSLVGLPLLEPIIRLFGASDAVLPYARDFLAVLFAGNLFFSVSVSLNSTVRAEGGARDSMVALLIGAVANAVLEWLFIFRFGWGMAGASGATIIACALSALWLVRFYLGKGSTLGLRWADLWPDLSLVPEILAVGSASFVRVVAGSFMAIIVNQAIATYGSDLHLGAFGVANRVLMLCFLPILGIMQGMLPVVGFNHGAGRPDRVRTALLQAVAWSTGLSALFCALVQVWPSALVALFTSDAPMLRAGPRVLSLVCLALPLVPLQFIGAGFFQAVGRAGPSLVLALVRHTLFIVPLVLLLPRLLGLDGVWLAFPASDLLGAALTAAWLTTIIREEAVADGSKGLG